MSTLYWCVRRELWENRWLYIVPLIVAAVSLLAFAAGVAHLPVRAPAGGSPVSQHLIKSAFDFSSGVLMLTYLVVGVIYCLEALHGERRDRSILFWKSLPVSDLTTVLAKACVAILILPLITFAIIVVTQGIMLLMGSAVLLGRGVNLTALWVSVPLPQMWLAMLYHLMTVHALYYAPFYGWMLLVSGWARRAAGGPAAIPFPPRGDMPMQAPTLANLGAFLASPGLWVGLAIFALFLAAAVRLRRYQGPI